MAILLQADVWLKQDWTFQIPPMNMAIVRFTCEDGHDAYTPYCADWYYPGEVKFRAAQVHKYYDRVRANPTYAVITVREWFQFSDYYVITPLTEKRSWKTMIDWRETIRFLLSEVKSRFPMKPFAYEGPQSP